MAYRYGLLRIPGERPMHRMSRLLNLTPSQREQIGEVMQDTHARMRDLRSNFQRERRRLFVDTYMRIRALLTPEQQTKFDREFVPPRFRAEAQKMQSEGAPEPPQAQASASSPTP